MDNRAKEVSALTRTYDLLLWIIPVLGRFPKSQRFLLGERIENLLLDTMELIIKAVYTRNKTALLQDANLKIELSRHLVRLAKDLRYLSIKKYEYISRSLNDIGAEIGGWLKYSRNHRTK